MSIIKKKSKVPNRKERSGSVTKSNLGPKRDSTRSQKGATIAPIFNEGQGLNKDNNPFQVIKDLSADFGFSAKDMAGVLDVTPKTFSRWKQKANGMSDQQADRMLILKSIFELSRKVLGSDANVKKWMSEPVFLLDGHAPLSLLITESGRRRIESVLHQIEYGFF